MGGGHKVATITLILIFQCATFHYCHGKCQFEGWNATKKCPSGMVEIFRDEFSSSRHLRYCCNSEREGRKRRNECQLTNCGPSATPNLCSTLHPRIVSGRALIYEEVLRENCSTSGSTGDEAALCCVHRSRESSLASRLGAEPHEFPHMAKVKAGGSCGGTIYNKRYIITAAHCVVHEGAVKTTLGMKVILGTNIGEFTHTEHVCQVEKVIPHQQYSRLWTQPEFRSGSRSRLFNDIALLRLNRDIKFGPTVKALELAPKLFNASWHSDHAVVVGWGITNTLRISAHLQKANFLIRSDESCLQGSRYQAPKYFGYRGFAQGLMCVGGIVDGKWSPITGQGDSGGPAICRGRDGRAVLCGVSSFGVEGETCLKHHDEYHCRPSAYVEVSFFREWIEGHAGKQDLATLYRPSLYGENVGRTQYPHQVHITSTSGKSCGGTLLSKDVIITAAQCVSQGNGNSHSNLKVTVGQHDLNNSKEGDIYQITKVTVLEGFKRVGKPVNNTGKLRVVLTDNYHKNDLALLKLSGEVSLTQFPRLPREDETLSPVAFELSFMRNTDRSGRLKQREFQILGKDECDTRMNRVGRRYRVGRKIDRNFLCAVEKFSGGSLCDRELGGGLICKSDTNNEGEDDIEVLCGVQIFRLCESSIPNGFMDVSRFTEWVERNM